MMGDYDLESMVAGISRWVSIESPTSAPEAVNRMLDAVAAEVAGDGGIAIERIAGTAGLGDVLVLRAGPVGGARGPLVLSHVDTVHPIGTLDRDLPVRRDGDRLYGPGVYDMKGGAYLALAAFRAAARLSRGKPMTFVFTADEEIGSPTTRDLIETLGRQASHVLVTEPARDGGRCVTARKGVGRFDVTIEGRPAHSGARHADGRSAIREAAHQILAVEGMTDYARGVTTTVGTVSGGTAANVIPQHARFAVDLRVVTVADGEAFAARILGLKPVDPDVRITITGGMNRPPYEKTHDVAALYDTARSIAAGLGFDLMDVPLTGGGSDGNFTAALGIPTLDGLGIDGEGAHTLQEHGLVSSIVPRARLMEGLLKAL
ncbi:MAG: M20 family metallopeptidase [Burkholderiales bacterium]|nr:M20 family metallopeptidase [Burkholderiales bacterium]